MAATVTDRDHGYKAMLDRIYTAAKTRPVVRVGVQAADGEKAYVKKADRAANDNGEEHALTVLQVAIFNEFGTDRIPERSFLRAWFDANRDVIRHKFQLLMRSVLNGKRTKEDILELIGQWCVGQIQLRIAQGIGPPNAESTIARKGSSTPLIDTGVLRSSISYRVDNS